MIFFIRAIGAHDMNKRIIPLLFIFFLMFSGACTAAQPVLPSATSSLPPTATPMPSTTEIPTLLPTQTLLILTPTTLSSEPQTVMIYLIALDDNGVSGEPIGCGDSLVPVKIAIEPTVAVMRAAYTALLNLSGDMNYGESGLYNALYQSDLHIKSITIKDRQAIVQLTGDLVIRGVCDIPRIEAQLTAPALQFSTVDTVSVTINGTPLQEFLDLRD